jgi:serine/threonine protein kinase/tetratricopeptide (TPR) repeat protein
MTPNRDPGAGGPDFVSLRSLKRELLAEIQAGDGCGGAPSPEDVLARWPTDPAADPDVASVLFEDFLRRRRQGDEASVENYSLRFPEHRDSLASLVRQQDFLRSLGGSSGSAGKLRLPAVGESLFGFRLCHELGRGSFARVFLAEQADLAGRPVVLKVSDTEGDEPQTLAQLQHTHIVPIYSVHENAGAGLRAVCMPYFGGASLSAVLKRLRDKPADPTSGRELVEALEAAQAPAQEALERLGWRVAGDGWREKTQTPSLPPPASRLPPPFDRKTLALLGGTNYVRAAAWITARLAEGLHHSHRRGILHRDVKPSNVLLSADGQPMLLDFNLSEGAGRVTATLGGTVAYMAPEHLRALATRDQALARQVDHRADVYALGMVFYEMLAGHSPFDQSASYSPMPSLIEAMAAERGRTVPSLRAHRKDVPWGLESIVRKCLAPDPAARYQHAEHLAEDLQRFLDDRSLRHAPELSRVERIQKWARRHPRWSSSGLIGTVAAALLLTVGSALFGARQLQAVTQRDLQFAHSELERDDARFRRQEFESQFMRALCLVNTVADGQDHLQQGIRECERALGLYGVLDQDDWQRQPSWYLLPAGERQAAGEDVREVLLLLAWARVASAPKDPAVAREALALLDRAEAVEGLAPLRALGEDRANYLDRCGDAAAAAAIRERAERIPPATPRDHYLLATAYARKGRYAEAVAELDQALDRNPRHYWSLVQRGICQREMGKTGPALADFGQCVGLWTKFAWGHFNLGSTLEHLGERARAINCYTAAIQRDPEFTPAYLNRGLARLDEKQYQAALDDFTKAAGFGRDDALLHGGRGVALEGLGKGSEADAAFGVAFARASGGRGATGGSPASGKASTGGQAASGTQSLQIPLLLRYGFSVYKRLPEKAEQAFAEVLRRQPAHLQALYGRAMVLVERGEEKAAVACFGRALEVNPGFTDARRFRAVLLARAGDLNGAVADVNRCLEQEPGAGVTLYAAACVLARGADQAASPERAEALAGQALEFLRRAFEKGYGRETAVADPDLRGLRRRPEFQQLVGAG